MKTLGVLLGFLLILVSLLLYFQSITGLAFAAIGYTGEDLQTPAQRLILQIAGFVLFISNIALTFAGVQLMRGRNKISTYALLIFGLFSLLLLNAQQLPAITSQIIKF